MNTLAVVEEVLRETATPMTVKQIVQRAGARLPSKSKTPDTVVARDLSVNIKKFGEQSLFVRTAPGLYGLREPASAECNAPVSVVAANLRHERAGPIHGANERTL
ncbi:MAG: winged helix-turn-helix domain-containing protein, partial [Kofleriaceae bacterium]|nr:winged helix-turn-helix domain-containing protein [Kofleriaceae bacterium]